MTVPFLGLPEDRLSYSACRVAIVPVPFEASVSFGKGTAAGPQAILDASTQVELFDAILSKSYPEDGIFTLPAIETDRYDVLDQRLYDLTRRILDDRKFPIILGGEHSISVSAARAFRDLYPNTLVIHVDAHADLRDSYQDRTWSHACAMHRIRDLGLQSISIGIRSMSEDEAVLIREQNIFHTTPEHPDFWNRLETAFGCASGPAWMTFDVDGFDPSVIPSTGTPEPGGLTWMDVMRIFGMMRDSRIDLKGADFVELAPIPGIHHPEFTIARLIHRFILMFV